MKLSDHADEFYRVLAEVMRERAAPMHDRMIEVLADLRERRGRLFCLGVGGGAANAAHAVCDFRKLCGIESYAPSDGIAELTARANDEGWSTVFRAWLETSFLGKDDAIFVFSVGGGYPDVSACIHEAVRAAQAVGARVLGVVAHPCGAAALAQNVENPIVITHVMGPTTTPVTEAAQIAVLHALVSDPRLQINRTKW